MSTGTAPTVIRTTRKAPVSTMPTKLLYRVEEAIDMLSVSRSTMFELLRSGRLRSVKEGRTRLIPASALREYVALLESEVAA